MRGSVGGVWRVGGVGWGEARTTLRVVQGCFRRREDPAPVVEVPGGAARWVAVLVVVLA